MLECRDNLLIAICKTPAKIAGVGDRYFIKIWMKFARSQKLEGGEGIFSPVWDS